MSIRETIARLTAPPTEPTDVLAGLDRIEAVCRELLAERDTLRALIREVVASPHYNYTTASTFYPGAASQRHAVDMPQDLYDRLVAAAEEGQ